MADLLSDADMGLSSDEDMGLTAEPQTAPSGAAPQQYLSDADMGLMSDEDMGLPATPQGTQNPLVTAGEHALARAPVGAAAGVAGMAGAEAGLAAGTAAAPFLGPLAPIAPAAGAILGGLGVGSGAAWLASKPVDWLLDKLGLNDSLNTGAQQNPTAAFIGDVAGNVLPAFGTGAATATMRGVGAAIGGGLEAEQEYANEGKVDPTKVAIAAGANALFARPRPWAIGAADRIPIPRGAGTGAIQNPVASSPEQPGRPDLKAIPAEGADKDDLVIANDITTTAPGIAADNPPAPEVPGAGNPTGAPMLERSAARPNDPTRNYSKNATPANAGVHTQDSIPLSTAAIPEDVAAASAGEQPPDTTGLAQPDANGRIPLTPDEPATPPAPAPQPQPDANGRIPLTPEEPDQGLIQSAIQRGMRRPLDNTIPMPSIANSGKARNSPVYIDPLVPAQYHRPLAVHETVEQTLMAEGIPYAKAHEVATQAEKQTVERAGMNWDEYTESMAGLAKKIEAQKVDPESYAHLDLHVDPEEAIGHHADKNASAQDVTAAVTPQEQRITDMAHQYLDETIKLNPAYQKVKDRLSALPPKEQAVAAAQVLNAKESVSGEAPGTGEVRVPTQRPQVGEAMARSKPDAARKQTALDAWKAAYQKFGPSAGPLDPADTAAVVERAKAAVAAATEANGGKDPLESYRVKKNIPPEAKWLRAARNVVRNPSAGPIKEFTAAHALGGETGQNIEGELANKRLPTETGADLSEAGRETFEPLPLAEGKDNSYAEAHNELAAYLNDLPNEQYRKLAEKYNLRAEMDQPADPAELMSDMKQVLADTGKRPGIVEVPAEDIPGKKQPVTTGEDIARLEQTGRFEPTEASSPESPNAAPGRTLDKNSPEFKKLAAQALGKDFLEAPDGATSRNMQTMKRSDMPKNLNEATDKVLKALGINRTEAATAAINAGDKTNASKFVQRTTRGAVQAWLQKNPITGAATKVLSIRGMYSRQAAASATTLRKTAAQMARTMDQFYDAVEPLRPIVNRLDDKTKLEFQQAMQAGGTLTRFPELQPVADALSQQFKDAADRIKANNLLDPGDFLENYFPQRWENTDEAREFLREWTTKQGSTTSLKHRTFPTIADGIAAGLKPKFVDPIEAATNYLNQMERFIALNKNLNEGMEQGYVRHTKEPGDVELHGRMIGAGKLFAPEDWARNYNNFYDPGVFHSTEAGGRLYDIARRGSNAITALELAGPVFHTVTMANEALVAKTASALAQGAAGNVGMALKRLAGVATAPISYAKAAKQYKQEWLQPGTGTPEVQRLVNIFQDAGGRMVGFRHDPTYEYAASPMDSFWKAWQRGALPGQARASLGAIGEGFEKGALPGLAATAGQVFHNIGRALQTIQEPLFAHYIPAMKTGVSMEQLADWLKLNPDASHEQAVNVAQRIVDSTDNRLGEMIQDNIFWNKTLKESAQLMMRSYSWNLGTVGEIGGGALKAAMQPQKLHSMVSAGSAEYDPRVAYTLALPVVVAATSAMYQYLKTGKPPEELADLVAGKSGGTLRSGKPERTIFPGYEKDILGWFNDPTREAANKIATAPRLVWETLTNKDWRDDPIADENAPFATRLAQYAQHVWNSMRPIYADQLTKKPSANSNISAPERALSLRPAPAYLSGDNPAQRKAITRQWKTKEFHDKRAQQYAP